MPDVVPVRRALLSVSDKADLLPLAHALIAHGIEIVSTGGTAKALGDAGLNVTPIDALTGFPEIMGGRVKTLHPAVHGALLGVRDHPDHQAAMTQHGIKPIDLVCVNLYPFEKTIANPGVSHAEAIEQIDIGGPSMIRSAAKNFEWVTVVTSPKQYDRLAQEMATLKGGTTRRLRAELAAAAFARTSEYDAAIANALATDPPFAALHAGSTNAGYSGFPHVLRPSFVRIDDLRYGENPHQSAALYRDSTYAGPSVVGARQVHGKDLSYNNIADAAAALEVTESLGRVMPDAACVCIIKHTNPCGASASINPREAVELAIAGDPLAAYGGILSINRPVTIEIAARLSEKDVFFEVIVAPAIDPAALDALRTRWQNLRILIVDAQSRTASRRIDYKSIPGGMLAQEADLRTPAPHEWVHAGGPAPRPEQIRVAAFLEGLTKAVSSNAIVIGGQDPSAPQTIRLFGAGGGQVDRLTACRIAVTKAGALARGAVAFGDAFFPFPDGPGVLINAGVSMLVHPGGSKRDQETFDLCATRGVTCLTTGIRHFRH
jgi:phosphoribosylaminoimidazolecarboxamide formyltransferase / IMP cyclohydrolase